jgi:hypothetical protein
VIEKIRRALKGAASQPGTVSGGPSSRTLCHRRCACGAHSRGPGGRLITHDAQYNAQRHMWYEGVGHPMPEVCSTEKGFVQAGVEPTRRGLRQEHGASGLCRITTLLARARGPEAAAEYVAPRLASLGA